MTAHPPRSQQKPNPQPSATQTGTQAAYKARGRRRGRGPASSNKPSPGKQHLGPSTANPASQWPQCLAPMQKTAEKRGCKKVRLCPAATGRAMPEGWYGGASVPWNTAFTFSEGTTEFLQKEEARSNTQNHFSHFPFTKRKRKAIPTHSPFLFFMRLMWPARFCSAPIACSLHVSRLSTWFYPHVTKLALLTSVFIICLYRFPDEITNSVHPAAGEAEP